MKKRSLGLIETIGFVPAVEAADAGVKAANVSLLGCELTWPARLTVMFLGDVGAVNAAVSAGTASAKKVGEVISSHIIPRPDNQFQGFQTGAPFSFCKQQEIAADETTTDDSKSDSVSEKSQYSNAVDVKIIETTSPAANTKKDEKSVSVFKKTEHIPKPAQTETTPSPKSLKDDVAEAGKQISTQSAVEKKVEIKTEKKLQEKTAALVKPVETVEPKIIEKDPAEKEVKGSEVKTDSPSTPPKPIKEAYPPKKLTTTRQKIAQATKKNVKTTRKILPKK